MSQTPLNLVLPYRGEFGFLVGRHAPQIHALRGETIVACEAGLESLYPTARAFVNVDARPDVEKRARPESGLYGEWKSLFRDTHGYPPDSRFIPPDVSDHAPRQYFVPTSTATVPLAADVVICPRRRDYGTDKNWPAENWKQLSESLEAEGLRVFVAGTRGTSFDIRTRAGRAWDFLKHRPLDASIQAMHQARLTIATDAGLAHLAVACARPLLMISYRNGLVAPGHDDVGNEYWPIYLDRYEAENHRDSPLQVLHDSWDDPDLVANVALAHLAGLPDRSRDRDPGVDLDAAQKEAVPCA